MPDEILAADFNTAIPVDLRPYIAVASNPLPLTFSPILEAFRIAVDCIHNKVRIRRLINIIVGTAPFQLNLGNGLLSYAPHNENVINVHIEDMIIYLDTQKMLVYPREIIVACILEEFAHALMCIQDEDLVSHVVALLYDGIKIVEGKYEVKPTASQQ